MRKIGLEVTRKAGSPGSKFIPVERRYACRFGNRQDGRVKSVFYTSASANRKSPAVEAPAGFLGRRFRRDLWRKRSDDLFEARIAS